MHHDLDLAAYLRLDALNSLGASPTGASFATSSGDVLEIGAFGPGTFRLRVGPNTRPDYGLLAANGPLPPAMRRWNSPVRRCDCA
jgi:hypothetical protein